MAWFAALGDHNEPDDLAAKIRLKRTPLIKFGALSVVTYGMWPLSADILEVMASSSSPPQLDRPIVVIGSPRSGTTLLGNLLGTHPLLSQVEEPRLTWKYGNDDKSDMLRAGDARPEVCQHIRRDFGKAVSDAGRERLIEKTPSNSLRMEFVDRVLPGCIFIHTVRDGVESVLSIRKFWEQYARGTEGKACAAAQRDRFQTGAVLFQRASTADNAPVVLGTGRQTGVGATDTRNRWTAGTARATGGLLPAVADVRRAGVLLRSEAARWAVSGSSLGRHVTRTLAIGPGVLPAPDDS